MPNDPPTPYDKSDDPVEPLLPGSQRYTDYKAYSKNRLDYKLAEIAAGDHSIFGTHEMRVIQIAELEAVMDAVHKAGNHRHTEDWDWAVEVTMSDGERVGDGWSLEIADKPDNFTACIHYDKVTHVTIEGVRYNEEEDWSIDFTRQLCINQITNIYWEWQ